MKSRVERDYLITRKPDRIRNIAAGLSPFLSGYAQGFLPLPGIRAKQGTGRTQTSLIAWRAVIIPRNGGTMKLRTVTPICEVRPRLADPEVVDQRSTVRQSPRGMSEWAVSTFYLQIASRPKAESAAGRTCPYQSSHRQQKQLRPLRDGARKSRNRTARESDRPGVLVDWALLRVCLSAIWV